MSIPEIDRRYTINIGPELIPLRSWTGIKTGDRLRNETPLTDADLNALPDRER